MAVQPRERKVGCPTLHVQQAWQPRSLALRHPAHSRSTHLCHCSAVVSRGYYVHSSDVDIAFPPKVCGHVFACLAAGSTASAACRPCQSPRTRQWGMWWRVPLSRLQCIGVCCLYLPHPTQPARSALGICLCPHCPCRAVLRYATRPSGPPCSSSWSPLGLTWQWSGTFGAPSTQAAWCALCWVSAGQSCGRKEGQ